MSHNCVHVEQSKAHHAQYAHAIFLSKFVSVANKGSWDQLPKLEVAGSIPVARSTILPIGPSEQP